jgi:hypothetical protein
MIGHYDASLETRDALVLFYATYNPAKLDQCTIESVLDGWHGREVELFRMLHLKYEIAPHSGTKSGKELSDLLNNLSSDKAESISRDSVASAEVTPPAYSFFDSLRYLSQSVCCVALKKSYYEVDSQVFSYSMVQYAFYVLILPLESWIDRYYQFESM